MHRPIKDRLEEFLRGSEDKELLEEFEDHLEECDECFQLVEQMQQQAHLLHSLRAPAPVIPDSGFYARVMQRVEAQPKPGFWSIFLDPAFGRRLMYATAALLVLLGTYLVSTEPGEIWTASNRPEVILAGQDKAAPAPQSSENQQQQRDAILVNLATYQE